MPDLAFIRDVPLNLVIFVIWYFSFRDSQVKWKEQLSQQKDFITKTFEILNGMMESTNYQNGMMQKIYAAIENNWYCPEVKKVAGKRNVNEG